MRYRLLLFFALAILVSAAAFSQNTGWKLDSLRLFTNTIASENPDFKNMKPTKSCNCCWKRFFPLKNIINFLMIR